MKRAKSNMYAKKMRTIATHSLVAAIFSNPYLLYLVTGFFKLLFHDTATYNLDTSLISTMGAISSTMLIIAIVTFAASYLQTKNK